MKRSRAQTKLMFGASLIAVAAVTTAGGGASAQTAPGTGVAQTIPESANADAEDLVVVGVRRAEQSAIQRKKNAATAQDSIVADDVGQFPDKNAAEAIARIAGVALDVGDSGEQGGFTIRGQAADLIRVEVDGMTSLSTNSGGGGDGRSATVADISSDLIKSVDVVKGQTADMTPGGVGGTVRIEQRTGLDFSKPLYRLNVQFGQNTLAGKWAPRINGIVTQKFFDDRVGLLINATYERQRTSTDYARNAQGGSAYLPFGDHDNSPEKTFTTPFDPLAGAVTTKAGCAALPTLPASIIDSRRNCYAQWEDYAPTYVRPGRALRDDQRLSVQVRLDWQTTDNLRLFASYNPNIRKYDSEDFNYSVTQPTGSTNAAGVLTTNMANVQVNENHYVTSYDFVRGTGSGFQPNLALTTQNRLIERTIEQHYAQAGADWTPGDWFVQARAQYSKSNSEREDFATQLNAPLQSINFSLIPNNGLWTFTPAGNLDVPEAYFPVAGVNGISNITPFDYIPTQNRSSEYNYQLDVAKVFDDFGWTKRIKFGIQRRNFTNNNFTEGGYNVKPAMNGQPAVTLSRARSLDQFQFCDPNVLTATAPCAFGSARRTITAGTTDQLYKNHTLTETQFRELIFSSFKRLPGRQWYSNYPGRGDLATGWSTLDVRKFRDEVGKYADLSDWNLDCLTRCIASDGNMYDRAQYSTNEITTSAYAMVDFETSLFGMLVAGNSGVRYQRIQVQAEPVIDFSERRVVPRLNGTPGLEVQNVFIERQISKVDRTSEDWLPSFNLALWPVEDKLGLRYSIALQRARPSVQQLAGNGASQCGTVDPAVRAQFEAFIAANPGAVEDGNPDTDDEAGGLLNAFVNSCTGGRIGNPSLKGFGATTQNLSLEWYPNRDSQLTAAVYQIAVRTGRPENFTIGEYELNGDVYQVGSFRDGQGGLKTRGFEIAGRTAFTFLPSFLRFTGGGFNYSLSETNLSTTEVEPFTGIALPPRSQSNYYYNINLWYDDTRLNARIAYQARDIYYLNTNATGTDRIPASAGIQGATQPNYFKSVDPSFRGKTESLDARAAYKINDSFQLFVEGKNLIDNAIPKFTPEEYRSIGGGTPYLFDQQFSGRLYYAGVIVTF